MCAPRSMIGLLSGLLPIAGLGLPAPAQALACEGDLPATAIEAVDPAAPKFRLAQQLCGLAAPAAPRREAAQLSLYGPAAARLAADTYQPMLAPTNGTLAVTHAGQATVPRGRAPAASVQRIRTLMPAVADAARRWDIDPLLLHAVAHVESRHDPQAMSHAGARGVMQVMPATARRFGVADPQRELQRPALNIDVGAEYLKTLQQRFGNDLPLVLAAYNAGEGAVEKHGRRVPPYPETQRYVRDVIATYDTLRRQAARSAR